MYIYCYYFGNMLIQLMEMIYMTSVVHTYVELLLKNFILNRIYSEKEL